MEGLADGPGFVTLSVSGTGAAALLAPEAGGHRWQRVPPTERRGRVHSSTVTVAVLPAPSAGELVLNPSDLAWETKRGSGPGGQHRNKTESTVRVTHLPTGVTATCDSRSQSQNKVAALEVLRARLQERSRSAAFGERNAERQRQVGTGERGDKVRTVSVPRATVVDHRTGRRCDLRRYLAGELEAVR